MNYRMLPLVLALLWGQLGCGSKATTELPADSVAPVEPGDDPELLADECCVGVLTSEHMAVVTAQLGGRVQEILVSPGQRVRPGDPLLRIDDGPARQQLANARNQLRSAQAARRGAALAAADALAKHRLEDSLFKRGVSAREAVRSARVDADIARASRSQADAEVASAQAAVDEQERRLEGCTVRSGQAGVVSHLAVRTGEQLTPGTRVLQIFDPGNLRIRFAVPASHVDDFQIGTSILLTPDRGPGALRGQVSHVSAELEPPLRLFFIEAELKGDRDLSPRSAVVGRVSRVPSS